MKRNVNSAKAPVYDVPTHFERITFRTWLPFLFANVEIIFGLKTPHFKVKDKKCHETISARERPFKSLF